MIDIKKFFMGFLTVGVGISDSFAPTVLHPVLICEFVPCLIDTPGRPVLSLRETDMGGPSVDALLLLVNE